MEGQEELIRAIADLIEAQKAERGIDSTMFWSIVSGMGVALVSVSAFIGWLVREMWSKLETYRIEQKTYQEGDARTVIKIATESGDREDKMRQLMEAGNKLLESVAAQIDSWTRKEEKRDLREEEREAREQERERKCNELQQKWGHVVEKDIAAVQSRVAAKDA